MDKKQRTKVLVLIDWYLPGYKAGGPIQSLANLVENLNEDFNFSIVTRNTDYLESNAYPNIESDQWIDQGKVRLYYASANKLSYSNLREILLDDEYDRIYINSTFSYYFTLVPLWIFRNRGKDIIFAPRGMLAKSALAIKPLKKRVLLFICNILGLYKDICFQATSESEVEDIQAVFGADSKVEFAPNIPALNTDLSNDIGLKKEGSLNLINIARIAPEKNLLYALNVLKHVNGKVQFDIYGSIYDENYWKMCEDVIAVLPENVTVSVKSGVNRTGIFPLLQKSHFLFMPSKGENFGHIIIESLTCGCPVIISDQTPWRELEKNNIGYDIDLGKEKEFIKAIEDCVKMGQEEYNHKSSSSVQFAKDYAANSKSIQQSRELFNPTSV